MPDAIDIMNTLRTAREAQGIPLRAIAESLKSNAIHISHLERGLADPRLSDLIVWADMLGMELVLRKKS